MRITAKPHDLNVGIRFEIVIFVISNTHARCLSIKSISNTNYRAELLR